MDDLDDHLPGLDRLQNGGADSLFTDLVGEGADHFESDVGLEKGTTDLAQSSRDIRLGQCATAGQSIQNGSKSVLEVLKHRLFLAWFGETQTSVFSGRKTRRKAKNHPRAQRAVGC